MKGIIERIDESVGFIRSIYPGKPEIGVVLGSGLGNFTDMMKIEAQIDYGEIPHFPQATVEGHSGRLILGELGGKKIVAMAGRFHFYEGYSAEQVAFPIRVMKGLGINALMISNAAGGVNPDFKVGDLMMIKDHISFATANPLIGPNPSELGPRFPDMSEPYSKKFMAKAQGLATQMGIRLQEGVYFGVTGPTFETRAEYKLIRILGADAVGMSTVQEVIIAAHLGLPVFAMSVITDIGIREEENAITHEDVLHAAKAAEPQLSALLAALIQSLDLP